MVEYTSISIIGHNGQAVPNTLIKQDQPSDHLALVFPGYGYRATMPVLYYPSLVLLNRGADVLLVEYDYRAAPGFAGSPAEERERWLGADVQAAAVAGVEQRDYARVTLVGKSIGTLAMGLLIASSEELATSDCIWLTPLVRQEALRRQIEAAAPRSVFCMGTADPNYDERGMRQVTQATGGRAVLIPNADHSLEIKGDALASVDAMRQLVEAVEEFVVPLVSWTVG